MAKIRNIDYLDCPSCGAVHALYATSPGLTTFWEARCVHCDYVESFVHHPFEYTRPFETPLDRLNFLSLPTVAENSPGVEVDQVQDAIKLAAKTATGVSRKTSTAHQLLELFKSSAHIIEDSPAGENSPGNDLPKCSKCFDDGYVEDEFGRVKLCQCEPKLSHESVQSVIAPAANISINAESDLNPILTGIALSDRFLARYSPPVNEIEFNVETDGQLTLIDFKVVGADEAPDPDDFESLDAFREAIAIWDAEHGEPNSVRDEPLEVSLDSFCEWAPCPADWYEPAALLEPSEVSELSAAPKSSITSDFTIPTFDAWCDRPNGIDEPPDT